MALHSKKKGLLRHTLSALLMLGSALSVAHPFHASVTKLTFNVQSKSLEFALRLPTEDLESALCPPRNCQYSDSAETNAAITDYLEKHIKLDYAGKKMGNIKFVGKESDFRVTWIYYEIALPAATEPAPEFCLDYPILMELDPQQINTIDYKNDKNRRTVSLNAQNTAACFPLSTPN